MSESEDVEPADTMAEKITSKSVLAKRRQTYYIRIDLVEKLKSYAYWERRGISETVNMALEEFLKDWSFKEIPRQ